MDSYNQPLIPAEQYFAGGMDSVRGYLTYEAIGDHAIRGRAELTTPEALTEQVARADHGAGDPGGQ